MSRIADAWRDALFGLQQMNQASTILPNNGYEAFRLDNAALPNEVKVNFGPIVFNIPERPNHRSADLYVVAKGWLTLEGDTFKHPPLMTKNFGTEVGYFRRKGNTLEHVFGAHFDMDETHSGHPIFHVQFGSQQSFVESVHSLFNRSETVVDRLSHVLGTVRIPTAQMDIFSVVAQIGADHLMWRDSSAEVKTAFARVRRTCGFLVGAAHRLPFLNEPNSASCYRGSHWYEAPAANA